MDFNYKDICKSFVKGLPQRTTDVIERRFGLKTGQRETLGAIGQSYNITRERVRQIEKEGFSKIRPKIKEYKNVFQFLNKTLECFGGIKEENALLKFLGKGKFQNYAFFLLFLAGDFKRFPEDDNFNSFWAVKKEAVSQAKKIVRATIKRFEKENKVLFLPELLKGQKLNREVFLSCLEISKQIQKNPEDKFGLRDWIEINPRSVKDKAYLVLKKQEKPLHFSEIANFIEKLPFPSKGETHVATVHNELIKDQRFVLVGRGLYALKEWGYEPGIVKDIIYKTLKEAKKSLSKNEILNKVLGQRFVKANTVVLNLQDKNYFEKDEKGRYTIREA